MQETFTSQQTNELVPSRLEPTLIYNDFASGRKVLTSLMDALEEAVSFDLSVAFINLSGIEPLKPILKELEQQGVKGRILTTDYLCFTDPAALDFLCSLSNIEVRMFQSEQNAGFHTKYYLFEQSSCSIILIGSSNLTAAALSKNMEWNVLVQADEYDPFVQSTRSEFERLWQDERTVVWNQIRDEYRRHYLVQKAIQKDRESFLKEKGMQPSAPLLSPNSMQAAFIENLEKLIQQDQTKALLVSATGTGKTYAAAFAMKKIGYDKVLFVVHREQIARAAMESFRNVMGEDYRFGLLSGTQKDLNSDYLFATIQTLSKPDVHEQIDPRRFDAIIIDEVHRAGAQSYTRIMEWFQPRLWLGMSATPQRMDGYDIYGLFDHNIAYEVRLRKAMEADLLCPFHYFAISDLTIENQDTSLETDPALFKKVELEQRAEHMIEQARYYGYSGNRVRGLIFVSSLSEGRQLSNILNTKGLRTLFLSGANSQEEREAAVERLKGPEASDALDYILSVDIFNEGVDIPELNQIILMRPTQSPVIFVQQLGRGLRKAEDKDFTVVLDFIGVYDTNYMIPMAIYEDNSYNKDNLRRVVSSGSTLLPGASTIHFDKVAKSMIFQAVDQANFSVKGIVKNSYQELRNMLGRIPRLEEFDQYQKVDPIRIFLTWKSYPALVHAMEKTEPSYGKPGLDYLNLVSIQFGSGKKSLEPLALSLLIENPQTSFESLWQKLKSRLSLPDSEAVRINLQNQLTGEYYVGVDAKTLGQLPFYNPRTLQIDPKFQEFLENKEFVDDMQEILDYALMRNQRDYPETSLSGGFHLYGKYSYKEVFRILNWSKDKVSLNIGGYAYDEQTNTYPVFINYHKDEDISETTKYEDVFLDPAHLHAISKSKRTLESKDVQNMLQADKNNTRVLLFVRKDKNDGSDSKEFYYLGDMHPTGYAEPITMQDGKTKAVRIGWKLDTPVRNDIYDYITLANI